MLYGLDLFSGIAGNTLGLREWVKTIAYCESDRHAQSVLLSRMQDGSIERAPIWDNITTLRGEFFNVPIDIIIAGFPCQDISVAGRGEGLEGKRSGLFFEVVRLAKELEPTFLFLENVPAIRTRGLDTVIQELTALGYDLRWTMLSAQEVGAPHKRERWFCLAYSNGNKLRKQSGGGHGENWKEAPIVANNGEAKQVADSLCEGLERQWQKPIGTKSQLGNISDKSWWETEPNVGRVVDGVPFRVDRLKRLGNAVVPLQAKTAFEILIGITKP